MGIEDEALPITETLLLTTAHVVPSIDVLGLMPEDVPSHVT
jgi:hypothetical protein